MGQILIKGGAVVTMEPRVADLPVGDVLIENDRIAAIAPDIPTPGGAQIVDAADCIVLPGLINAHVHTWRAAGGTIDDIFTADPCASADLCPLSATRDDTA
jgi:5-methylthioadenosine/S-adenosylhomocysteine deaminase